tara:strand:+ start:680 stop:1117 length:438 start_codon:yes stop_codon:yes gene_type:complete
MFLLVIFCLFNMIKKILYDDILVRHWILPQFNYSFKDVYKVESISIGHYLFELHNCIHYKSLVSGDYSDYIKLITTSNQLEHSLDIFLKLKDNFNLHILNEEQNKIRLSFYPDLNKYVIRDGVHRLSILLYNKVKLDPNWFVLVK